MYLRRHDLGCIFYGGYYNELVIFVLGRVMRSRLGREPEVHGRVQQAHSQPHHCRLDDRQLRFAVTGTEMAASQHVLCHMDWNRHDRHFSFWLFRPA